MSTRQTVEESVSAVSLEREDAPQMNSVPYWFNTIATLPQSPQAAALPSQAQGVYIALASTDYQFTLNNIIGWFRDREEVELIDHGVTDKLQDGGYIILEWEECEVDQLFLAILRDEETVADYTVYTRDLMKGRMNMAASRMQSRGMHILGNMAHWPPLVYVIVGIALIAVWALGTSVQVLTSEAWMLGREMKQIDFTAFGQLWQAVTGHLAPEMLVPFMFGWGVQFALIVASIGIELPPYPRWRYWLALISVIGLICVNSCGDFVSSSTYGFWGQCGFTLTVFFVTFCMLLFAIMALKHAVSVMRQKNTP